MKSIDCQGLPCPQPVLKTRELLAATTDSFDVIVDNAAAVENVSRFLNSQNCPFSIEKKAENKMVFHVAPNSQARPAQPQPVQKETAKETAAEKILLFITSDVLGNGDRQLGQGLMKNFIATLPELGENLWRIVLVNSGVKLAVQDSPVLDQLQELEQAGVSLLVCGTCLNFYNLLEQKRVGQTTNMLDIVTSLDHAGKVINL